MGRTKTTVGTAIMRVIKDEHIPDSVKIGVSKALYENGDIRDYVLEDLIACIGVKAERMYAYGRDHYTYGLPSGQFTVTSETLDTVMGTVLLSIENVAVDIDYLRHGSPNNLHIGWSVLMASHGYDPATNQLAALTVIKGTPVYLHDMVVMIPSDGLETIEPFTLEQWGIAAKAGYTPQRTFGTEVTRAMVQPTPVQVDTVGSTEYLRVEYVWIDPVGGGVLQDSFTIPITGYDDERDYFHVRYRVGGVVKYWMYLDGAGLHLTLDEVFDLPIDTEVVGSFFPFAYFRYDHVSQMTDPTSAAYQSSKKLVKYLGMDYAQLGAEIDANPDIADVAQAMLILAVPANTTNELERRYLWEFFNNLFLASDPEFRFRSEELAVLHAAEVDQLGLRAPGVVIQDTRFKMSLDNTGIYKRRKAGNIGPVGTHHSSVGTVVLTSTYFDSGENPIEFLVETPVVSHYYRRQISTGFYDEIQVVGMRTQFHIFEQYTTIGDELDTILLIPLDRAITSEYSIPEREILYSRSLHFVFNSLIVTKVKWYQTGVFAALLTIVAIVAIVVTWGSASPVVVALIAEGAYAAAAYAIMIMVIKYMVAMVVFRLFVKVVGIEAAFVIAVIAAMAGLAGSTDFGASLMGAPFAADLLALSSGLSAAISDRVSRNMLDLMAESKEFDLLSKEKIKLLDTANDLLDNRSMLSPFVIFGEKPDDFYNRTVHSGNIGVVGVDIIHSFVDMSLALPKLHDSIEGNPT